MIESVDSVELTKFSNKADDLHTSCCVCDGFIPVALGLLK